MSPSRRGAARSAAAFRGPPATLPTLTALGALAVAGAALLAAPLAAPLAAQARGDGPPDLVLVGGKVFTADPARPWAEALAVRGAFVVAVGTTADIARLVGPRTRRVALGGRTVVPGFNDAHAHVDGIGPPGVMVRVDTAPLPDPALPPVLDSLAAAARRAPPDTWLVVVVGGRVFDDPRATRAVLDSVVPRHPVWLVGAGAHGVVLNTAGLRAAGLLDAPDPLGGWLTRDAAGRPTGRADEYVLVAARRRLALATGPAALVAPRATEEAAALRLGLTTVQEMATGMDLATARWLYARRGDGPALGTEGPRRRLVPVPVPDAPGGWRADAQHAVPEGSAGALAPRVRVSGVKWILDGSPIERGALLREPYADRPGWYGRANFPFDTLRAHLREARRRGQQPVLHAVGDSTIALVIAAMRAEAPDSAWRRLRPRLEHADLLGRDQLPALRALGVVVQNPAHLASVALSRARFGAERLARTGLLRTLVDSGVPLALGSDGPRAPGLNVLLASRHPNVPGEALTREQAVSAYTRGSAYAEGMERETGTLAPGMRADLVVLSADVFTAPLPALPGIASVLTVIDGRVAFDDGSLARTGAATTTPAHDTAPARNTALVNGRWFTGSGFEARTVYSVGARFTSTRPARIDTTVDLTGTWVVPPFGEAHNHNVDGVVEARTRAALARYVADGVFYVQIQGNYPVGDALRARLPMNRPDGPDVALAQAFVTASGGHPIPLHETVLLPQGYYPGFTRERLRDSLYVTLDSAADLAREWPRIRALRPDFIKAILWGADEHARRRDDAAYVGRRGLDPRLLRMLVERAHRDGLRVSVHINTAADFHHAVAAGVDMIAHGGSPSFFNTVEDRAADPAALREPAALQRALLDALRAPAANGRGYVPIAESDAREAARRGIAVVTTVALLTRAPEPARAALRPYVAENLRRLRDAGVTLVVGSDNPMDTSTLEFEQLAALGVWDNLGLLKLWSEATPRAIFPGRRIGALAEGYEASFLALDGDPLADLAAVRRIRLRFKQGVLLER